MTPLKNFLFGLSGLGITSSSLLAWLIAKGDSHRVLSVIFQTKSEADNELIKEGERECGEGTVWIINNQRTDIAKLHAKPNSKGKNWDSYQSCLKTIGEKEKYKKWYSQRN